MEKSILFIGDLVGFLLFWVYRKWYCKKVGIEVFGYRLEIFVIESSGWRIEIGFGFYIFY